MLEFIQPLGTLIIFVLSGFMHGMFMCAKTDDRMEFLYAIATIVLVCSGSAMLALSDLFSLTYVVINLLALLGGNIFALLFTDS